MWINLKNITLRKTSQTQEYVMHESIYMMFYMRPKLCDKKQNSGRLQGGGDDWKGGMRELSRMNEKCSIIHGCPTCGPGWL